MTLRSKRCISLTWNHCISCASKLVGRKGSQPAQQLSTAIAVEGRTRPNICTELAPGPASVSNATIGKPTGPNSIDTLQPSDRRLCTFASRPANHRRRHERDVVERGGGEVIERGDDGHSGNVIPALSNAPF